MECCDNGPSTYQLRRDALSFALRMREGGLDVLGAASLESATQVKSDAVIKDAEKFLAFLGGTHVSVDIKVEGPGSVTPRDPEMDALLIGGVDFPRGGL